MYCIIQHSLKNLAPITWGKVSSLYEKVLIVGVFFMLPLITSASLRDSYTVIKWKLVHVFAILALFQLLFMHKKLILPNLGRPFTLIFLGIIGLWGWEYYFHQIPFFSAVTLDRAAFVGLVLFFYKNFKDTPRTLDFVCHSVMASMVIFAVLVFKQGMLTPQELFAYDLPIAVRSKIQLTFGNENMAAQFISVSFLCIFREIFVRKTLWIKILCGFFGVLTALFLLKTGCRSALLGVSMGAAFYGAMQVRSPYRGYFLKGGFILGICLLTLFVGVRTRTVQHRQEMWTNAIQMVKDYPFGVGRERFNFYHVLYQSPHQIQPRFEGLIERTPHNEALKYLVEEGWIFLGLVILMLVLLLKTHGSFLLKTLRKEERLQWIGGLFFVLGSEFSFQFPFEIAFPYLMVAYFFGYILSVIPKEQKVSLPLVVTIPGFFLFVTATAFLFVANLGHGSKRFDSFFTKLGCRIAPYEWRTCDQYVKTLEEEEKWWKILPECLDQLERRPYNFTSLVQLGRAYFMEKDLKNSCKVAWFYDRLFDHQSHLKGFVTNVCPRSDQEHYLNLSLKDHYRGVFDHLSEAHQKRLLRRV